jgi:hypothetical protein
MERRGRDFCPHPHEWRMACLPRRCRRSVLRAQRTRSIRSNQRWAMNRAERHARRPSADHRRHAGRLRRVAHCRRHRGAVVRQASRRRRNGGRTQRPQTETCSQRSCLPLKPRTRLRRSSRTGCSPPNLRPSLRSLRDVPRLSHGFRRETRLRGEIGRPTLEMMPERLRPRRSQVSIESVS